MNIARWLDRREPWWQVFIFAVSVTVIGNIGYKTYQYAPPVCDFVVDSGKTVFSGADITAGQKAFLRYGLMEYGSFLGDGAMRGPDFTAEALHQTALSMNAQYSAKRAAPIPDPAERKAIVEALVQKDIKENRFRDGKVTMNAAQAAAFERLRQYYAQKLGPGGELWKWN